MIANHATESADPAGDASAALREGRTDEALVLTRRALAERPDRLDLHRLLTVGHHRAGSVADAEKAARRAVAAGDTTADAHVLIGVAAQAAGAPDRAAEAFARALSMPGAPPMTRQLHASALIELGRYDAACEELLAYLVESHGSPWWPDTLAGAPAVPPDGDAAVSDLKLRHDIEQLKHLEGRDSFLQGHAR